MANDYFDHKNKIDDAERLGPERVTASGKLRPEQIQNAYRLCFGVAALLGFYLSLVGGVPIVLLGLLALLAAYTYTGGPYPLSYVGLGEVLALVFFGPVAVWGTVQILTGSAGALPILVGLGPGSIALAIMGINNMRDRLSDAKTGKLTIAVLAGEPYSRWVPLAGIIGSIAIAFSLLFAYHSLVLLPAGLCFLFFYSSWQRVYSAPINKAQNKSLGATGQYMLVYCLLLSVGILFA